MHAAFLAALERIVRRDAILRDETELLAYESDGLARLRERPGLVVLPNSAEEVQGVVRACHEHGVAFVARGHGTGLSGGALPVPGAVLIVLTLALGVGANTAVFSVVKAVLLQPLAVAHADRLVRVYENVPPAESPDGRPHRFNGMFTRDVLSARGVRARSRT